MTDCTRPSCAGSPLHEVHVYEQPWDRDAEEALGYIFQPDWWPPSS